MLRDLYNADQSAGLSNVATLMTLLILTPNGQVRDFRIQPTRLLVVRGLAYA